MAVTSIKIYGGTQLQGRVAIAAGTGIALAGTARTGQLVMQAAFPDYIKQAMNNMLGAASAPYVSRINTTRPLSDGQFFMLGSGCTSIVTRSDTTADVDTALGASQLLVADLCQDCGDCQGRWTMMQKIQQASMWLAGLKDCQLYTEQTADKLWDVMEASRLDLAGSAACTSLQPLDRVQEFRRSTKLFYQYKALVSLWNYIVATRTATVNFQQASQDYAGFAVQTKRNANMCGSQSPVTLSVEMHLIQGQGGTVSNNIAAGCRAVAFATLIASGTSVQKLDGSGQTLSAASSTVTAAEASGPHVVIQVVYPQIVCQALYSFAAKIIPFILLSSNQETDAIVTPATLQQYVDSRQAAEVIDSSTNTNRWQIKVEWTGLEEFGGAVASQVYYYTTGQCKHPSYEAPE